MVWKTTISETLWLCGVFNHSRQSSPECNTWSQFLILLFNLVKVLRCVCKCVCVYFLFMKLITLLADAKVYDGPAARLLIGEVRSHSEMSRVSSTARRSICLIELWFCSGCRFVSLIEEQPHSSCGCSYVFLRHNFQNMSTNLKHNYQKSITKYFKEKATKTNT